MPDLRTRAFVTLAGSWLVVGAGAIALVAAMGRAPQPDERSALLVAGGLPRLPRDLHVAPPKQARDPSAPAPSNAAEPVEASCYIEDPGFGPYDRWVKLDHGRVL